MLRKDNQAVAFIVHNETNKGVDSFFCKLPIP